MDWQAFGAKIGLPTTGDMGNYYRPQIEEAMRNEQSRSAALGNQPGYQANTPGSLQGGNSMGGLMQATNQAAGRMNQAQSQPMMQNQAMPNPYMPQGFEPGMAYAGGSPNFDMTGRNLTPQQLAQGNDRFRAMQASMSPGGQSQTQNLTQNPYMNAIGNDITRRAGQQFTQQIAPSINRAAVANGGYGGSRQGIAQGLAMSQGMDNVAGQLSNLYGQQFNADRNYGLQSDALDLNVYNANMGWMNQGQQNQLNTLDRLLGWNQQYGIGNATNVQNTPLNYWQAFNQGAQGLGGMGGTGTQNLQGNPWLGALGGYQLGSSLWRG